MRGGLKTYQAVKLLAIISDKDLCGEFLWKEVARRWLYGERAHLLS